MSSRLTRLELHGYKTFASHTEFQFSPSVTAIVGPNGSGKSNIADAVRWVLGEQAYSALRGKRTEDMIFSGSQSRSPAGLAQVLITFDNAEGWLPIEFTEVSVGRRAYRDGKNEYLINGQKVRLRDITELLARCGLGERTYNIVGQGLVDSALSLRAEDRRALFEEAAGIGLQRQKREEALRRLEATQHNLERVQDILAELRPRLRGLERQARRALEYEQVRADLRALLRLWYGYHWHAAQQELLTARRHAEAAGQQRAALLAQEQALESDLAARRERILALQGQLRDWQRELAQLAAERETVARDLAVTDERARALTEGGAQVAAEIAALQAALTAHQERLGAAESEHAALQDEAAGAARHSQEAQARLAAHESRRVALRQQQSAARHTLESLADRLAEVRVRRSQFGQRREQLAARREAASVAVAAAEASVLAQAEALQTAEAAHQRARQASVQAQAARDAGQARAGEHEARLAELAARQREMGGQEARLHARHEVLAQAERNLEGYASGAQGLLAAGRAGRLPGLRGALSQALSVPAELEAAVAAALGNYLEAVVLEAGADLEAVLEQLGQPGAGRTALLPLGRLTPPPPPAPPLPDGEVIGAAAALISAPGPVRAAVELLLADVIVVRDRAAARRLSAGLPPGGAVVTLAGEVFFAAGPVLAGGAGSQAGVLARARQARDVAADLTVLRQQISIVADQRAEEEASLQQSREAVVKLEHQYGYAQSAARQAAVTRDSALLALERARQQAEIRREQLAEVEKQARTLEDEQATLGAQDQQLLDMQATARAQLAAADQALGEIGGEALAEQAAEWATRAAVARRAAADSRSRLDDLRRARDSAASQLAERTERAARLADELAQLATSGEGRRQLEQALAAEIEGLRARVRPAEASLLAEEAQARQAQAGADATRAGAQAAERRHSQAQLDLTRKQDALEHLRRQIEDDFGLVEFEYADDVSGPTPLPLGEVVEKLQTVESLPEGLHDSLGRRRLQLRRMGAINPEAPAEFKEVSEREAFLTEQVADLSEASARLQEVIAELDQLMQAEFRKTFDRVAEEFSRTFNQLFGGGSAKLVLTDPDDLTLTGIDIQARLPGRRPQSLALLSGGERSLTASALIFALLRVSPPPFCLLDEVDAALDESNVGRFREMLSDLSRETQFIVITHNRGTVQAAELVYGITMNKDSTSQAMGLRLEDVAREMDGAQPA